MNKTEYTCFKEKYLWVVYYRKSIAHIWKPYIKPCSNGRKLAFEEYGYAYNWTTQLVSWFGGSSIAVNPWHGQYSFRYKMLDYVYNPTRGKWFKENHQ